MQRGTPGHKVKQKTRGTPAQAHRQIRLIWLLPALGVVLAALAVAAVVHDRMTGTASRTALSPSGTPAPANVVHDLRAIPDGTWNRVGAADADRPALTGPPPSGTSAPVVLYIGAEYCPYCAALRWPLVAALDRFGTFTGLELSTSSATDVFPSTATLTFVHARFRSPYLTLQAVELQGNTADASGQYPPLQRPTSAQAALFRRDNPSGDIPFLLIGNRYMLNGSPFSPALLQRMNWQTIAASLPLGKTAAARTILANANEITAAICAVDGEEPSTVCHSPGVLDAAKTLPSGGK